MLASGRDPIILPFPRHDMTIRSCKGARCDTGSSSTSLKSSSRKNLEIDDPCSRKNGSFDLKHESASTGGSDGGCGVVSRDDQSSSTSGSRNDGVHAVAAGSTGIVQQPRVLELRVQPYKPQGVVGINLAGDPLAGHYSNISPYVKRVKALGLKGEDWYTTVEMGDTYGTPRTPDVAETLFG
ncbi:hypothetical protein SeMB42_g07945 [Synchytrium endobioticum]|uniref:Uncharacterized protein n=1 Tax=Synchytrium endobioticum TaxID=286115 RepID=A0A507BR46_9FUNG|nr:hypothetical protein SeMB42_g07945 [Synchytrium endobioticum]